MGIAKKKRKSTASSAWAWQNIAFVFVGLVLALGACSNPGGSQNGNQNRNKGILTIENLLQNTDYVVGIYEYSGSLNNLQDWHNLDSKRIASGFISQSAAANSVFLTGRRDAFSQTFQGDAFSQEGSFMVSLNTTDDSFVVWYKTGINFSNGCAELDFSLLEPVSEMPLTEIDIEETITPNAIFTIDTSKKFQYVDGFGGTVVSWVNFPQNSMADLEKMYNPNQLGYNIMRIMIMAENPADSTNPEKTIDYYVSGKGGTPHYINGVKLVNQYKGYVLASPWTPPAIWKSNNSINGGGYLLPARYNVYANYLRRFCEVMYERGAPIYAVSIQNEPNYVAGYDGCEWTPEQMRDFHKQEGLFTQGVPGYGGGKALDRVLIMTGESANNPSINDAALNDPASRAAIDLIGRHLYGNSLFRYAKALDHPSDPKRVWMTEHNINSANGTPRDCEWNHVWRFMNDVDVSLRLNDESAFIWWTLKQHYSMIGAGFFGAADGAILPRGYGLSHYAKFAKETWRVELSASGTTADGKALFANDMGGNFNNIVFSLDSTAAKATAFVSEDGKEISVIMFTPTLPNAGGGVDMGTVEIKMPQGFTIGSVTAIRSTQDVKTEPEKSIMLNAAKTSAFITLPPSNIVSVKFTAYDR